MIQESFQQEILSKFDKLSEKLGLTIDHLWPHLVRLTVLESLGGIVLTGLFTISAGVLWLKFSRVDTFDDDEGWLIAAIIVSVVAGIGILLVIGLSIPVLLEPEAATVRKLFS